MRTTISRAGIAPASRCTSRPSRNSTREGMLRMPKRAAKSGSTSVSTLATTRCPARSPASASSSGATARQGPHHAAQKSTNTGKALSCTNSLKSAALRTGSGAVAGSRFALHAAQRARWASRAAGSLFSFVQERHSTTTWTTCVRRRSRQGFVPFRSRRCRINDTSAAPRGAYGDSTPGGLAFVAAVDGIGPSTDGASRQRVALEEGPDRLGRVEGRRLGVLEPHSSGPRVAPLVDRAEDDLGGLLAGPPMSALRVAAVEVRVARARTPISTPECGDLVRDRWENRRRPAAERKTSRAAVVRNERIGVAVNVHEGNRPGWKAGVERDDDRARDGGGCGELTGQIAGESAGHHPAVREAGHVDASEIDAGVSAYIADDRRKEALIVAVALRGGAAARARVPVSGVSDAVRIGDQKAFRISEGVHRRERLLLGPGEAVAMKAEDQGNGTARCAGRHMEDVAALGAAVVETDDAGRGRARVCCAPRRRSRAAGFRGAVAARPCIEGAVRRVGPRFVLSLASPVVGLRSRHIG